MVPYHAKETDQALWKEPYLNKEKTEGRDLIKYFNQQKNG
jgi:hypothetical protein